MLSVNPLLLMFLFELLLASRGTLDVSLSRGLLYATRGRGFYSRSVCTACLWHVEACYPIVNARVTQVLV